jgi:membrane protease YdiL (CAAX protease family)
MFDSEPPPAYPSQPPPPADESIRPMTYMGAALWATGIHIAFLWIDTAVVAVREGASRDLVAHIICQVAAYAFGLFLLLRVHGPHTSIRRFVGMRATNPMLVVLGALLGLAVTGPAHAIFDAIEARWPQEEGAVDLVELFFEVGRGQQALIVVGMVLLGPFVEELVYRGALFGTLRQGKRPHAVVLVTAVFFSLIHLEPRRMPPIFLVGLLLGYLRHASGSLLPAIALHTAFNAVPFGLLLYLGRARATQIELPDWVLAASLAVCALLICAVHLIAQRSRMAQAARARE